MSDLIKRLRTLYEQPDCAPCPDPRPILKEAADALERMQWNPIEWDQQDGSTYAWVLGLHYYSEQDEDGRWPTSMMIANDGVWDGITCESREDAEAHMQADYEIRLSGAVMHLPPEGEE